jgi:cell division protein FtsW (lipid II flippase)
VVIALRIIGLTVVIALGIFVLAWVFTGNRRWLRIAWRVFRYAVFGLVLVLILFAGEALFHAE